MTDKFKEALNEIMEASKSLGGLSVWFDKFETEIISSLTIATEAEQLRKQVEDLRKERDELAARVKTLETIMREECSALDKVDKMITRPAIDWWWLECKSRTKRRVISELEFRLAKKVTENGTL